MGTYVVGDIHGCFLEWITLKRRIEVYDSEAVFILTGDILDRGPHVYEMLQWAMEHITPSGKYQMILGNHEFEKINWIQKYFAYQEEAKENGEDITLYHMHPDKYDFCKMCKDKEINDLQLKEILNWLKSLPYFKEKIVQTPKGEQRYIIVHAAVPTECLNKDGSFNEYSITCSEKEGKKAWIAQELRERILWDRDCAQHNVAGNTIIVHGHTPTIRQKEKNDDVVVGKIKRNGNDINIDCGIVYGALKSRGWLGDLAAIRLEDLEEFYYYNHNTIY